VLFDGAQRAPSEQQQNQFQRVIYNGEKKRRCAIVAAYATTQKMCQKINTKTFIDTFTIS
jgi:hypothetical protein